ncbi:MULTISPECIES: LytTR family transcriptional regulator DNA-binding domain-containing protein [Cohnella]|uniref:LytTR family transcriptional regulator DNA-binding domain-containing protein n=1 Tax=Cohnella TaxID=329857 RepID=UPI0009BBF5BD|nr:MULTISPECIES: LytTR family transcriptional regulator DNA-binding domain-containing protein [Cohnella]MBN2979849.1 LytTR family transcriptional regulator DNA-binding domain-containing protein [Cohnella algarum]
MGEQIRLLDKEGKPCTLELADIVVVKPSPNGPVFLTKDETYFYPTTLEELQVLFKEHGFERLDRTNLANLNRAEAFDPKTRKVYFDYPWGKDSRFATVSEANVKKVDHLVKEAPSKYKPFNKPLFGSE